MTIFESVRQFISLGDVDQALQAFINHCEKEKNAPEALRILLILEANFKVVQDKERKGIIDFKEAQQSYNGIADRLLELSDDLEAGKKPSVPALEGDAGAAKARTIYWLIGVGILLALGLIAGILLRSPQTPPAALPAAPTQPVAQECPDFDTTSLTVMLIPFKNLADRNFNPEAAIQTRIQDLTTRNKVPSDVQIYPGKQFEKNQPDIKNAAQTGRKCAAKMVIWGTYEKQDVGISIDVRYVFTENPNLPDGAIADTFKNLTELKSAEGSFSSLDDAVFSLCTMMALHEGNLALAKQWSDKVQNPGPRMTEIKKMLKKMIK